MYATIETVHRQYAGDLSLNNRQSIAKLLISILQYIVNSDQGSQDATPYASQVNYRSLYEVWISEQPQAWLAVLHELPNGSLDPHIDALRLMNQTIASRTPPSSGNTNGQRIVLIINDLVRRRGYPLPRVKTRREVC